MTAAVACTVALAIHAVLLPEISRVKLDSMLFYAEEMCLEKCVLPRRRYFTRKKQKANDSRNPCKLVPSITVFHAMSFFVQQSE